MNDSSNIGRKKLTLDHTKLKLGNSKIRSIQSSRVSSGKTITTIEVRKKKTDTVSEEKVISLQLSSEENVLSALTVKEQISRISALQNANIASNNIDEEKDTKKELESEEIEEISNSEDSNVEDQEIAVEQKNDVVDEVVKIAPQSLQTVNAENEKKKLKKNKKVSYDEEKAIARKAIPYNNDLYKSNVKLIIDEEILGEEANTVSPKKRSHRSKKGPVKPLRAKISRKVLIPDKITVSELASRMSERVQDVLSALYEMGDEFLTSNSIIDAKKACDLVLLFNNTFKLVGFAEKEESLYQDQKKDINLQIRPPVVTVMGHVDHGKTSLLDALRDTNVVKGEFGGITQHIGAYQVVIHDHKITFIDTPGHEAFTSMRSRGANITDIVVLVIAADDGIMPQTVEAINHAKAAGVAIIVAVNKIDKPGADVEKVTNELLQYNIVPESLGGDVMIVPVSAKNKINLDKLCEAILLMAELLVLKSPVDCRASGIIIESKIEKNYGIEATLIVQKGCLKIGDIIVVGNSSYGKVRCMFDARGEKQFEALPSSPVRLLGLNSIPISGDSFLVVNSEKQARSLIEYRAQSSSLDVQNKKFNINNIFTQHNKINNLNIILKCDTMGSGEAICDSIKKLSQGSEDEIKLNILHSAVGNVTDSDILLAETSGAVVLAFNVKVDSKIKEIAKRKSVDIRHYTIIYELFNDIKSVLSGMLSPREKEVLIGNMNVKQCFSSNKQGGAVVGCYVSNGIVKRNSLVKLISEGNVIYEGKLKVLRRFKEDVKEVKYGFECGVSLDYSGIINPGDIIEVYELIEELRVIE